MRSADARRPVPAASGRSSGVSRLAGVHGQRTLPTTRAELGRFWTLVAHLAMRRLSSTHRFTVLGWTWPLVRQLAQLAVLVFVFSALLDLGIENYAVFVFVGLMAWTWFSGGIGDATSSVAAGGHLVRQAGFPDAALPVVAVVVPLIDLLIALPVLFGLLALEGELHMTALALPGLLVVQLLLMCGLGWLAAATAVYLRDVRSVIGVGLMMLFYMTPVFYDAGRVPDRYEWVLRLNPLTTLLDAYRAVLLGRDWPSTGQLVGVAAVSVAAAVLGLVVFRRLQPGFVDEL